MSRYPDDFDARACDASVAGGDPTISRHDVDAFVARAGEKFDALVAEVARDFDETDMAGVENWAPDVLSFGATRDNFMIDVRDALARVIRKAGLETGRGRWAKENCPGHIGAETNAKTCVRCGCHIDGLRP